MAVQGFRSYPLVKPSYFLVAVSSCPDGWISGGYWGSCYRVVRSTVDVSTAKAACVSMHSDARLVAIESDAEWDFLRRHYQDLYDNDSECTKASFSQ